MDLVSHIALDRGGACGGAVWLGADIAVFEYYELFGGLLFAVCRFGVGREFVVAVGVGGYVSPLGALVFPPDPSPTDLHT